MFVHHACARGIKRRAAVLQCVRFGERTPTAVVARAVRLLESSRCQRRRGTGAPLATSEHNIDCGGRGGGGQPRNYCARVFVRSRFKQLVRARACERVRSNINPAPTCNRNTVMLLMLNLKLLLL